MRQVLLLAILVLATGLLAGCATPNPDGNNVSSMPWNRPQQWESGAPMGMPGSSDVGY